MTHMELHAALPDENLTHMELHAALCSPIEIDTYGSGSHTAAPLPDE
ncbi:MAG TPA: hypothetical protein PK755_03240 [Spirochaetota bacterium]|nr:hypothetical protein [Spirochaetota bacterium]HPK61789.1 hypothetical protein [Spirochaetota bacterium]HQH29340.1 hypothetical protein [Spirochaetota bacterium]